MLQLGIYTAFGGGMLWDISPRASNVVIVNGEHGFGTLTCTVKMALWEAFMLYDRPGIPMVQVTEYGTVVWQGRLEDVAIVAGGVRLSAFGYWRALTDLPYSAMWSKTSVSEWRPTLSTELAGRSPQMYVLDTNNRLYMSCVKGAVFGNTVDYGEFTYAVPNGGSEPIVALSFDYSMLLPANWRLNIGKTDDNFSSPAAITFVAATGILQTGTVTQTFAAQNRVVVGIYNNTGGPSTPAGETGTNFCQITNIRIKTTTSASVYADEIVTSLVSAIATNGQLSASAALISSPAVDLHDETYLDALPSDIIDHLAVLGDNGTPPKLYETGVWENQLLSFQPRGATARTWYVDISSLELERTINALYNDVYATYQESGGRTLRTAANSDSDSIARYGLTRAKAVQTSTTSATQAGVSRDAALQDAKDPLPRIAIAFDHVYDGAGSLYPLWMVRAWDTLVIRNLPATLSTSLDRIRQFRIIEARYTVDTDTLQVTPESRMPTLVAQAARTPWAPLMAVAPVMATADTGHARGDQSMPNYNPGYGGKTVPPPPAFIPPSGPPGHGHGFG